MVYLNRVRYPVWSTRGKELMKEKNPVSLQIKQREETVIDLLSLRSAYSHSSFSLMIPIVPPLTESFTNI